MPNLNSMPESALTAAIRNRKPGEHWLAHLATPWAVVALLLPMGVCHADIPTAQEDCVDRNAALCELNGIPYLHHGPCPAAARTVRPPGGEDCSAVANNRPEIRLPGKATSPSPPRPVPRTDLARLASTERWLLPTIFISSAALALALFVFLLRWLFKRRRAGTLPSGKGKPLLIILASGAGGLYAAYRAAGLVFNHIVASYHNNDTFGPALIASVAAVLAFAVVLQLASALVAGLLLWLAGRKPG